MRKTKNVGPPETPVMAWLLGHDRETKPRQVAFSDKALSTYIFTVNTDIGWLHRLCRKLDYLHQTPPASEMGAREILLLRVVTPLEKQNKLNKERQSDLLTCFVCDFIMT